MRKILIAASAALAVFFISCTNKNESTTTSSESQKNLEASRAISKAFETGNTSVVDSFVSDDFVDHTDMGDKKGKDSLKAMITWVRDHMKDMKTETVQESATGDYVYTWNRYTGTSDGSMGMPKGPYNMDAIEVAKFKDGKAVEHWSFMEMADMMKMMPPQSNMGSDMGNKSDTSKKETKKSNY